MNGKECKPYSLFSEPVRRAVLIALCLLALACAAARAESVRVWATAVVVDDQIRVGDLCELQGFQPQAYEHVKELVVTNAPRPGGSTLIDLDQIRSALSGGGVNLARVLVKGSSRCAVSRPAGDLTGRTPVPQVPHPTGGTPVPQTSLAAGETLRDAIVAFFQKDVEAMSGRVNVQFGRANRSILELSGQEFRFQVRRRSGRSLGMVNLEVTVLRDGNTVQTVPMVVSVSFAAPVVVARRSINAEATIQPDDVQLVEMTFTQFTQAGVSDPARVVGQRARRFIGAGETIQPTQLEAVPLVHRGQIVDVTAVVGGVRIVSSAKALQSGAYGERIELRSHDAKQTTITAVVTGPRRVEVRTETDSEGKTMLAGAVG